ncbi:MAG: hypothetical protein AAGC60_05555 [Acidobacteriota bacterium]
MGLVNRREQRGVLIGIEAGQRRNPSGICVTTAEQRTDTAGRAEIHFIVRMLEQLETGTTFLQLATRLGAIVASLRAQGHSYEPIAYVNATGAGEPLNDLLRAQSATRVCSTFFNHGDRRQVDSDRITLGKAHLVVRLQVLLQSGRLHFPRTTAAEQLAQELLDYEIKIEADANDRNGAFRVGQHDELVTALGLAVQVDPPQPTRFKPGFF